jgi:SprT-like family
MDLRSAMSLAEELRAAHGLVGWRICLDRAKTRAGLCDHRDKVIALSGYLMQLYSPDQVRDTILHEVAHALAGPQHHHDDVWRQTALRLGCSATRCVPPDAPRTATPWVGECGSGHSVGAHRQPQRVRLCSQCPNDPALGNVLTWTWHGRSVRMHPHYTAELVQCQSRVESAVVRAQLDLDATLGGGPDHPAVRTYLTVRPGQLVRITVPGPLHGSDAVVLERKRTRYLVDVDGTKYDFPASGLTAAT